MSDPLGVNRDGDTSSKSSAAGDHEKFGSSLGSSVGSKSRLSAVNEEQMARIPEHHNAEDNRHGWRDVDKWMESGSGGLVSSGQRSSMDSNSSIPERVEQKAKRGSALFKALRIGSDSVESKNSWGESERERDGASSPGVGGPRGGMLPPDLKEDIKKFRDHEFAESHFHQKDEKSPPKSQSTLKKALNFVKGNTMGLSSKKDKRKASLMAQTSSGNLMSTGSQSPAFGSSAALKPAMETGSDAEGVTVREGWLTKERQRDHQWWRRYFVLHDGQLSYYKAKLKGYINIGKKCQVSVMDNDKLGISDANGLFCFRVHSGARGRPLNVAASCEEERREWVDAILLATTQSEASTTNSHVRHPSSGGGVGGVGAQISNLLNPKTSIKPTADRRTSKASTVLGQESTGKAEKSSLEQSGPDREGWLVKEDPTSKNWRKRYFVLKGSGLWYYEITFKASIFLFNSVVRASQVVQPTLALNLKMEQHGQYPYRFYISSNKRVFNVAADSENDMMEWISEINKEIKKANLGDMPGFDPNDEYAHNDDDFVVAGAGGQHEVAPEGDVALVFTDVQSSTSLWEANPEAMSEGLEIHDNVLRDMIACKGGYEVKTEGDAFMVAFSSPVNAVSWCLDVQQSLLDADWPEDLLEMGPAAVKRSPEGQILFRGLKVRMGVHIGQPSTKQNPITGRMDYFGPMVNRSARVADAAHGGQVLVSQSVFKLIHDHLIVDLNDPVIEDHGLHMLKGLTTTPEVMIELKSRDLRQRDFPPLRTLGHPPTDPPAAGAEAVEEEEPEEKCNSSEEEVAVQNTPPLQPVSPGRALPRHSTVCNLPEEYGEGNLDSPSVKSFAAMLAKHSSNSIISVVGPAASGKTSVVTLYGVSVVAEFPGGVWFAPVSGAKDCKMACQLISGPLGVPLMFGESYDKSIERLGRGIVKRGRTMVILDDIELESRSKVGEILVKWREQCPDAVLVCTCREPLGLAQEQVLRLPIEAAPMTPVAE